MYFLSILVLFWECVTPSLVPVADKSRFHLQELLGLGDPSDSGKAFVEGCLSEFRRFR